jgi:carbonic anhydrase
MAYFSNFVSTECPGYLAVASARSTGRITHDWGGLRAVMPGDYGQDCPRDHQQFGHRRPLQHELADQDLPGADARPPSGQVAARSRVPVEKLVRPGMRDGPVTGGCGTMGTMPNTSAPTAWKALQAGNERFVAGKPQHLSQSVEHRASLAAAQKPTAVIFGCADSRVAAELIFDQGLGDMFVVRTVGQVIGSAVLGSIEYAVTVLNVPLVVVLGHDNCGAVTAALMALDDGAIPDGFVRDVVERVAPSILLGRRDGLTRVDEFEEQHVRETMVQLTERSTAIAERVAAGTLAIVGVTYRLADGRAVLCDHIGDIGE